jgi:hypothetical protein
LNLERDGFEPRGVDLGLIRRQFGVDGAQAVPPVIASAVASKTADAMASSSCTARTQSAFMTGASS